MEIWREVEDFKGSYQVSSYGRVISIKKGKEKVLKIPVSKHGYCFINLINGKQRKFYRINRLVALTFIPNPENKTIVNHIDRCKTNNNVSNLEWVTSSENTLHWIKDYPEGVRKQRRPSIYLSTINTIKENLNSDASVEDFYQEIIKYINKKQKL
jgi:hypothetical protein